MPGGWYLGEIYVPSKYSQNIFTSVSFNVCSGSWPWKLSIYEDWISPCPGWLSQPGIFNLFWLFSWLFSSAFILCSQVRSLLSPTCSDRHWSARVQFWSALAFLFPLFNDKQHPITANEQLRCTTATTQLHHEWPWGPTQPPTAHHHTMPTVTRATPPLWMPQKRVHTNQNDPPPAKQIPTKKSEHPPTKMNTHQPKWSPTSEDECPQWKEMPTNENEWPTIKTNTYQ